MKIRNVSTRAGTREAQRTACPVERAIPAPGVAAAEQYQLAKRTVWCTSHSASTSPSHIRTQGAVVLVGEPCQTILYSFPKPAPDGRARWSRSCSRHLSLRASSLFENERQRRKVRNIVEKLAADQTRRIVKKIKKIRETDRFR